MKVIDPITTDAYATFSRAGTATYFNQAGSMVTAAVNELRHNCWNPETGDFLGMLIEDSRTNYLLNSANLATQTRSLAKASYVLSFWGTGSIALSGNAGGTLNGLGAYPSKRVSLAFSTASAGNVTFTVSGTVQYAQLEVVNLAAYAPVPSSYIPTTSAPVTRAADVTSNTGLLISSFAETAPAFDYATTYALGALVNYNKRVYESLVADNLNHYPEISPTQWLDTGPSNPFAMFDRQIGKASTAAAAGQQLIGYVSPTPVDSVALIRLAATGVKVAVNTGMGIIKTQVSNTGASAQVFTGFTPGWFVTILFDNGAAPVSLVELVCGILFTCGDTEFGLGMGITDYSKKGYDTDTRISTFIEGPYAQRMSASVELPKAQFNAVYKRLVSLRARPSVWIATDDPDYAEGAILYAFFQDFFIVVPRAIHCTCSLELLSLT